MIYISINSYNSVLTKINRGVPEWSVPCPLRFSFYINGLNQATKFCKIHHFADDTNLSYLSKATKELYEFVNFEIKSLANYKISLNVKNWNGHF